MTENKEKIIDPKTGKEKEVPGMRNMPLSKQGRGRPKGMKNKKTLLQEVVRTKSEEIILKHFPKIVEAVVEQAKTGNMVAAKMIMDRIIPVKRAVELTASDNKSGMVINIENLIKPEELTKRPEVVDGVVEEILEDGE